MRKGEKQKKKEERRIDRHLNQSMRNGFEVKQDEFNIWDDKFGYILKDGKPTVNSAAFWKNMRRKTN